MKEYSGTLQADKHLRIGIVVSKFNSLITKSLLQGSLDALKQFGIQDVTVVWVPGAFEIPLAAKKLAQTTNPDAIICLGAVIRGATQHFDQVVAHSTAGIAKLALETNIPLVYEVLATESIEQALERAGTKAGNKGHDAVLVAIEMADLMKKLDAKTPEPHTSSPSPYTLRP